MSTDDQTSNLDQNDDGKSDKIADDDPDIKYNKEFMINFLLMKNYQNYILMIYLI